MRKPIGNPLAILSALAVGAGATAAISGDEISAAQFVKKASISNQFEIESSQLALERAQSDEVKQFANRMIEDHRKAGENMKAALAKSGLQLQVETELNDKHREKMQELREESGDEFDEEYAEIQENAHDRAVRLYERYAEHGDNEALREFATNTLPILRQHEESADELEDEHSAWWD